MSRASMNVTVCAHYFVLAVHPRQLNGYFLCPIWARIIYYNDLPCKLTGVLSPFQRVEQPVRTVPQTPSPVTTR
jgi:hypothetical protein